MRPSETMQRGRRSPASSVDEREAEANRKLALEVLTRRKPATGLPAVPREDYYRGGGRQPQRERAPPERIPAWLPRRLPIDGTLKLGSDVIQWRKPLREHIAVNQPPQQGVVHMVPVLPPYGWHPQMHPMMMMPSPLQQQAAERSLHGRYQQMLQAAAGYPPTMPGLMREVHHHHHHIFHEGDEGEVPGEMPWHVKAEQPMQAAGTMPRVLDERLWEEEEEEEEEEKAAAEDENYYDEGAYDDAAAKLQARQRGNRVRKQHRAAAARDERPTGADDARDAMPKLHPSTPEALAKFRAALNCGEPHNEFHKEKREALWPNFDGNANGRVTLACTNGGVMRALCNMWGREGDQLFHRYYRSYIRAWSDAKDAAKKVREDDDEVVTRNEFRLLLVYLGIYATWYEVFLFVDWNLDHRISRAEFVAALPRINLAGRTWANSIAFANATESSFDEIDQNGGGIIDLQEFCEWAERAEKLGGTSQGKELGVNEPIDRPSYGAHREWHGQRELELRSVDKRRVEQMRATEAARMRGEMDVENRRPRSAGVPKELRPPGW